MKINMSTDLWVPVALSSLPPPSKRENEGGGRVKRKKGAHAPGLDGQHDDYLMSVHAPSKNPRLARIRR